MSVDQPVASDTNERPSGTVAGGVSYAVASAVANILGYILAVGAARLLNENSFGALGAILALAIIGFVPGMALQVLHGRWVATGTGPRPGLHRTAVLIAVAILVVSALLTVPLSNALNLGNPWTILLLGLGLAPATVAAALQGDLLGHQRFGALSGLLILYASLRVGVGLLAAWLGYGAAGVTAGIAISAWVVLAVALWLAGPLDLHLGGPLPLREASAAMAGIAGLLVLANLDVVLARRVLDPVESGSYALGSLFTKAAFWAPQFLSLLVVPRLAHDDTRVKTLRYSMLAIGGVGAVLVLLSAAFGPQVVLATSGGGYEEAGVQAGWFAAFGALLALIQLVLYTGISRAARRVQLVPWIGVIALSVGVLLAEAPTVGTVIRTATFVAMGCLVMAVAVENSSLRHRR